MNTIEFSLAQIESADAAMESNDGPERILAAVLDMLGVDPVAAESILVARAADPACEKRLNYIRSVMYYLSYCGNISELIVNSLINIARDSEDVSLLDAATLAIAWNRFENASGKSFDDVHRFLSDAAVHLAPRLTDSTIQIVRAALDKSKKRKEALDALASGQLVIPEDVVRDILSRRGERSFDALGYHQLDSERLVRLLAWTSLWIRKTGRRRNSERLVGLLTWASAWIGRTGRHRKMRDASVFEVGTAVIGPRGLPHATIKALWEHDNFTNTFILLDAAVEA